MLKDKKSPLDKIKVPLDLMQSVGLLDDQDVSSYIQRDEIDLSTEEKIKLLAGGGLLTERQAAAYVHRRIEEHPREKSAEEMGIAVSTLDDYLRHAEDKIHMAKMTEKVLDVLSKNPSN